MFFIGLTLVSKFNKVFFNNRQIILSHSEFSKKISLENKVIKRNLKLDFEIKNDYEQMLSNVILKFFPVSHLEGFKKIQIEASKDQFKTKIYSYNIWACNK